MANIALFGTIFMDIKGFSEKKYDPVGRNVGQVQFVHGGVGRNVAENLAVLGSRVTFVSTLDDSPIGLDVEKRLLEENISLSYMKKVPEKGMGIWMAILDHNGDLAASISKMPDFSLLENFVEEAAEKAIAEATHVALEIDLTEKITRTILKAAKKANKPVYGIPGNLEVVGAHKDVLEEMECFICNDIEAQKLFGEAVDFADLDAVGRAVAQFARSMRLKSMVVTLGERGAVYYETGMDKAKLHAVQPVEMVDSTGAGDAFFSGVLHALVEGKPLSAAVHCGSAVAAYTIQSPESTCIGYQG